MIIKHRFNLSSFILGFTSMVGQIIIIRELVVVFYGNELSISVILASWLFWVSFGSFVLGRLLDRFKLKENLLSYVQLLTALILPLNIALIRNIKSALNISAGEIIGFMPILGSSFLTLSVICTLLGFTFTLVSKLCAQTTKSAPKAVGRVYLLEGLGAAIGGLIYSFCLIKTLTPFQNAFTVSSLNLVTSFLFSKNLFQLSYLIFILIAFVLNLPHQLEKFTRRAQFAPFKVVESVDSIYGNITITKTGKEHSFYENGLLLFTSGDLLTSEESVHYALLQHPAPKKILLIGGGVGGSLNEILKHPVEKVDYVELDPLIIKLAQRYLPPIKDKRLNIMHMDGREFVKKVRATYDVIILNLPDPYTAMLNRFYSLEFFREIKNILPPDGIFSFALTSSENYLNPEQIHYLASIYNTAKKEFADVKILPGDTATYLATDKPNILTYDSSVLLKRLKARRINTKFVREYYVPFKLNPLRIKYQEESIKEARSARINRDFRPVGYFYHMALWMSLFHSGRGFLPYAEKINIGFFILGILGIFTIIFLLQKFKKSSFRGPVVLSIGTTGMSEIGFQIIVILAFQFLYGYIYYKIGLILTSFMIGLVGGSFCINRVLGKIKNEKTLYLKTQMAVSIYPLILPLVFLYIARINLLRPQTGKMLEICFVFLPIIAGFIGGFQFPLANKICLGSSKDVGKTVGLLYGMDVLGACIGGLLIGIVLVPILGIIQTSVFLSIINALILILLSNRITQSA